MGADVVIGDRHDDRAGSFEMTETTSPAASGPLRRLGAMIYDALLVVAVLMVATVPFLPLLGPKQALVPQDVGALAYLYWVWECAVTALYFCFFWSVQRRTLGMQAWRLRIDRTDGTKPTWADSLARFASAWLPWLPGLATMALAEHGANRATVMPIGFALLGLGVLNYLAAYVDPERRAFHERWLETKIVRI